MWLAAALHVLLAVALIGTPQQLSPNASANAETAAPCDATGVIRCRADQIETVTAPRSLEDMRIIGKYVQLISERNRRTYLAWQTKSPSAAFELVRRVKRFPYLPYDDSYSIVGLEIILSQERDLVTVRYPRKPKANSTAPVPADGYAEYSTTLSVFVDSLQKEILKLKKYEK